MINSVGKGNSSDQVYQPKEKQTYKGKESTTVTKEETGVTLELGISETQSGTYSKPAGVTPNAEEVKKLWEKAEKATDSLREIVERLINRQGKKLEDVLSGKESLVVDDEARAEAESLISEDGEWGVKAVSDRIVDFAKAISGGDKSKLDKLKVAIEEGFKKAEEAFGGQLPDISKKTYDEVMRKLDQWEKEE